MLRGRKPLAVAAALAVFSLCLLAVLRTRPLPYTTADSPALEDGVPEMQVAPVVACPPVLVQGVRQGDAGSPPAAAERLATVYVITPTYPRAVQVPEMTRLAQTLMLTTNVFWVVTEDAVERTPAVTEILQRSGLPHVHILGLKPEKFTREAGFKGAVPRGVSNRMAALGWLRKNAQDGVFYFADDDNTYDYRLFTELAHTRRASAFPVGLVTQHGLSTPVVRDGVVVDFYDGWIGGRAFPMDMAGFAVSVSLLLQHPKAAMPFTAGYEEDGFLKSLGLRKEDLEPLADNCTKILVWHTQTRQPRVPFDTMDPNKYVGTNLEVLRHVVNPSSFPRPRTRPAPSSTPVKNQDRIAAPAFSSSSAAGNQRAAAGSASVSSRLPFFGTAVVRNPMRALGGAMVRNSLPVRKRVAIRRPLPNAGRGTRGTKPPTAKKITGIAPPSTPRNALVNKSASKSGNIAGGRQSTMLPKANSKGMSPSHQQFFSSRLPTSPQSLLRPVRSEFQLSHSLSTSPRSPFTLSRSSSLFTRVPSVSPSPSPFPSRSASTSRRPASLSSRLLPAPPNSPLSPSDGLGPPARRPSQAPLSPPPPPPPSPGSGPPRLRPVGGPSRLDPSVGAGQTPLPRPLGSPATAESRLAESGEPGGPLSAP